MSHARCSIGSLTEFQKRVRGEAPLNLYICSPLPGFKLPAIAKKAPSGEKADSVVFRFVCGILAAVFVLLRVPLEPTLKLPSWGKPLSFRYSCRTT